MNNYAKDITKDGYTVIGKVKKDLAGFDKVMGRMKYPNDIQLPGMLHGKVLKCPYPRADVLEVDTSEAEKLPGVKLVISSNTHPNIFLKSLCYVGADVACVVAETEDIAREALKHIRVKYKVLSFVLDPVEAMQEDAPLAVPNTDSNILPFNKPAGSHCLFTDFDGKSYKTRTYNVSDYDGYGDMEAAYEEVDLFVEDEGYACGFQQAPCLAMAGCVADYTENKLDLYMPVQHITAPKMFLSRVFGIPHNKINIINFATGGAFGSRLGAGAKDPQNETEYTYIAVAASIALGKPVRVFMTREEEFVHYWGRGSFNTKIKIGFKKDGTLVTFESDMYRNITGGGSVGQGTLVFDGAATGLALYSHNCKANRSHKVNVLTNGCPWVGWQGYGNPEMFLPVECTMDKAAEVLGMDPIELRRKNHMVEGDPYLTLTYDYHDSQWLAHTGIPKCIDEGLKRVPWAERGRPEDKRGTVRHGIGMALLAQQNAGEGIHSAAIVKMDPDGSATVISNYQDLGQGGRTACVAIAAEVLGLPIEKVRIAADITEYGPYTSFQACSSGLHTVGTAVYRAAMDVKNQFLDIASEQFGVPADELDMKDAMVFKKNNPEDAKPAMLVSMQNTGAVGKPSYGWAEVITGFGHYVIDNGAQVSEQGAVFAELDVDTETGKLMNIEITYCQDCGRAIFPKAVEGVYLSVHHAIESYTTAEQVLDKKTGKILNDSYIDYHVATIKDYKVDPVIVESFDPVHEFGNVGVGQANQNSIGPAISNAIYNAIGVRLKQSPFTPAKILKALGKI